MAKQNPMDDAFQHFAELFEQLSTSKELSKEWPSDTHEKVEQMHALVQKFQTVTTDMLSEAGVDSQALLKDQRYLESLPLAQQRLLKRFKRLRKDFLDGRLQLFSSGGRLAQSPEIIKMLGTGHDPDAEDETSKTKRRKGIKRKKKFRGMRGDKWMSI